MKTKQQKRRNLHKKIMLFLVKTVDKYVDNLKIRLSGHINTNNYHINM